MNLQFALTAGLTALTIAPQADASQAESSPQRLVLIEQFRSTGDETFFWTTEVQSRVTRERIETGGASFDVLLERLDAAYGGYEPVQFIAQRGVEPMRLVRAASREIELPGNGTLESFVNRLVAGLGQDAGSQAIPLFDSTISPLLPTVSTTVEVAAETLLVGKQNTVLYTFRTPEVSFAAANAQVRLRYHGFALIDAARTQLFHSGFVQEGTVVCEGKTSQVAHLVFLFATDASNEPLIPARATKRIERLVRDYSAIHHRPDATPLRPDVTELSQLPGWTTPVWLSGRVANASIGVLAERAANPLPLLSLGSIVLTDTALDFTGNLIWDSEEIRAGRRDEITGRDVLDGEVPSPLAVAYGADERVGMNERFALFRAGQTEGASRYGAAIFGLGIQATAASALLGGAAKSSAVSFASTTGSGTLSLSGLAGATSMAAGLSATTIGLGIAGAAGVAVVAASGGGGGGGDGGGGGNDVADYAGTYTGTWVGSCDGSPRSGDLTITIAADGQVTGSYRGDRSAAIAGMITADGTLAAPSAQLGVFDWLGSFEIQGNQIFGTGTFDEPYQGCLGDWSAQ